MQAVVATPDHASDVPAQGVVTSSTERFYEDHAAEYFKRTVAVDMSRLYDRFLALLPPGGRILDAGCGSGRDLRHFVKCGFRAMGMDTSTSLVDLAKSYSGAPCIVGRLESMDFASAFDGIWACASLLHLPKSMLASALRRIQTALVPCGILFASVQEGGGERSAPDGRFFSYYQPIEFISAVKDVGFVIEDAWVSEDVLPQRRSVRWVNVLARRNDADQPCSAYSSQK